MHRCNFAGSPALALTPCNRRGRRRRCAGRQLWHARDRWRAPRRATIPRRAPPRTWATDAAQGGRAGEVVDEFLPGLRRASRSPLKGAIAPVQFRSAGPAPAQHSAARTAAWTASGRAVAPGLLLSPWSSAVVVAAVPAAPHVSSGKPGTIGGRLCARAGLNCTGAIGRRATVLGCAPPPAWAADAGQGRELVGSAPRLLSPARSGQAGHSSRCERLSERNRLRGSGGVRRPASHPVGPADACQSPTGPIAPVQFGVEGPQPVRKAPKRTGWGWPKIWNRRLRREGSVNAPLTVR